MKYTLLYVTEDYYSKEHNTDSLSTLPKDVRAWKLINNKTKNYTQSQNFVSLWNNSNNAKGK